jgi:inosine-uridine nucleoside N-ribohydrolase
MTGSWSPSWPASTTANVKLALEAVSSAPVRPTALGLDVTHHARLLPEQTVQLARLAGESLAVKPDIGPRGEPASPVLKYLEGALRKYSEYHRELHGFYGIYVHDPLAVATAINGRLVSVTPLAVDVECRGELTSGQTVADWRGV